MIAVVVRALVLAAAASAVPLAQPVSGSRQSAWAYAATNATAYVAAFPRPLVVRLRGHHDPDVAVRFSCVSAGCTFPVSEQPDSVNRFDPRSYDVKSDHGTATLQVTLQVPAPGSYVVQAAPVVNGKARPARAGRFVLIVR